MQTIAEFKVEYLQYLDEHSNVTQPFPSDITHDKLITLYKQMVLTRLFDNKAVNLQRTGNMGTYPTSTGQEATSIGIGYAMDKNDVFCPYYRDQGASLLRNITMPEILGFWGGDERASNYANNLHDFPPCVPIANQCLHATGVAFAFQYRNQKQAAVTTIGEGGTSKGDFYEALNVAGCWNLPVIFVVINNQWAISVPRHKQTCAQTIAQKSIAAGFEGLQVDGNDVIAVVTAMNRALHKAYEGKGPTLIEAITYRLGDHTTADDASRYRSKEELEKAWQREPITRLRNYLIAQNAWSLLEDSAWEKSCKLHIEEAVAIYLNQPPQHSTDMIDYLFRHLPESLMEQRNQIEDFAQ